MDSERDKYREALKKTKQTRIAQEKIALVKDMLPAILRPNNMNRLSVLHDQLSGGLHTGSDEQCLGRAAHIREVLIFLVQQLKQTRQTATAFTDAMRKLLDNTKT